MTSDYLLKARQIKAARALLDWAQENLAQATGLSIGTIQKLERGEIYPRPATIEKIRSVFVENGIEFIEPGGVRHRQEEIILYSGKEAAYDFFNSIAQSIKKHDEIDIVSRSGSLFDFDPESTETGMERLMALKSQMNATLRCLLTEGFALPITASLCECRLLSKHYVEPAPCYLFADKFAYFETRLMPKIVVIQNLAIAQSLGRQFQSMWEKASPLQLSNIEEKDLRTCKSR